MRKYEKKNGVINFDFPFIFVKMIPMKWYFNKRILQKPCFNNNHKKGIFSRSLFLHQLRKQIVLYVDFFPSNLKKTNLIKIDANKLNSHRLFFVDEKNYDDEYEMPF